MVVHEHERLTDHQAIESRKDHGVPLPDRQLTDVELNGAHLEWVRSGSPHALSLSRARRGSWEPDTSCIDKQRKHRSLNERSSFVRAGVPRLRSLQNATHWATVNRMYSSTKSNMARLVARLRVLEHRVTAFCPPPNARRGAHR
jgi:hypothetical protein